jgi:penicillin-binding protein 1B
VLGAGLAAALLVAGLGAAGVWYVGLRLDDLMAATPWDVPSRLYPNALVLKVGQAVPPGPLDKTLESMGYARVPKAAAPGSFASLGEGRTLIRPRAGWPGLEGVPGGVVEVKLRDQTVIELKEAQGKPRGRVVIPPVSFAEIREVDQASRRIVKYADMPRHLVDAVIAIEDQRFLTHHGVDPRGLARAVVVNIVRGGKAQGGSTLTQQLAKNHFLTHQKTITRKLREVVYAIALERRFTKPQILELYLNEIYLGQRGPVALYGVGQAAYAFFSKEPRHLTLAESALLAGIIQAPNAHAPDRHEDKARARRSVVLRNMVEQGLVSPEKAAAADKAPIKLSPGKYLGRTAPYLVDHVAEELSAALPDLNLSAEGLTVETTLDMRVQQAAEAALEAGIQRAERAAKVALDGAVVVLDPRTGGVLAMVGGRDYGESQFNRVTQARRQPGSVAKPLVMLAALQARGRALSPTTTLDDEPLTLHVNGKEWSPRNSDKKFHGKVTLRQVLEQSLNVPTVRLARDVGLPTVVTMLRALGISGPLEPVPSLALGAFEVSPLEVASAFTALATDGTVRAPRVLKRVLGPDGKVLHDVPEPSPRRVAGVEQAFLVRDMMRGVLARGTAKSAHGLGYTHPAAGKTGTTNDSKDAWFVGFDADLLGVVWVGADQPVATGLTGGQAALPVWVDLMKRVRGPVPPPPDPLPSTLVSVDTCAETHQRASSQCPTHATEVFWSGQEPLDLCGRHAAVVNRVQDLLLHLPRDLPRRLADLFKGIRD